MIQEWIEHSTIQAIYGKNEKDKAKRGLGWVSHKSHWHIPSQ